MFVTSLIVRSKKFTVIASIHCSISEAHQVRHSLSRAQVSTLKFTVAASFTLSVSLQQNVFLVTKISEEIFFVTKNTALVTKYEFRH